MLTSVRGIWPRDVAVFITWSLPLMSMGAGSHREGGSPGHHQGSQGRAGCDQGQAGSVAQCSEGPMLGAMLCSCHLESLHNLISELQFGK